MKLQDVVIFAVVFWMGYITAPRHGVTVVDQRGCEEPALTLKGKTP